MRRLAAVSVLSLATLFAQALLPPAPALAISRLYIAGPVTVDNANPVQGSLVNAQVTLVNQTGATFNAKLWGIGGRGPRGWEVDIQDCGFVSNYSLASNYQQSFQCQIQAKDIGTYTLFAVYQDSGDGWHEVFGANGSSLKGYFTVQPAPAPKPDRNSLPTTPTPQVGSYFRMPPDTQVFVGPDLDYQNTISGGLVVKIIDGPRAGKYGRTWWDLSEKEFGGGTGWFTLDSIPPSPPPTPRPDPNKLPTTGSPRVGSYFKLPQDVQVFRGPDGDFQNNLSQGTIVKIKGGPQTGKYGRVWWDLSQEEFGGGTGWFSLDPIPAPTLAPVKTPMPPPTTTPAPSTQDYCYRTSNLNYPNKLAPGQLAGASVTLTNCGRLWDHDVLIGTWSPRDAPGILRAPSWIGDNRALRVPDGIANGGAVEVNVQIQAPQAPGVYTQGLRLVAEWRSWMMDGPSIWLTVQVGSGGPVSGGPVVQPIASPKTNDVVIDNPCCGGINIRSGPGTGYAINCFASDGSVFAVVDGPVSGDRYNWLRLRDYSGPCSGWAADFALKPIALQGVAVEGPLLLLPSVPAGRPGADKIAEALAYQLQARAELRRTLDTLDTLSTVKDVLSLLPIIGDLIVAQETVTGRDVVTQQVLPEWDRQVNFAILGLTVGGYVGGEATRDAKVLAKLGAKDLARLSAKVEAKYLEFLNTVSKEPAEKVYRAWSRDRDTQFILSYGDKRFGLKHIIEGHVLNKEGKSNFIKEFGLAGVEELADFIELVTRSSSSVRIEEEIIDGLVVGKSVYAYEYLGRSIEVVVNQQTRNVITAQIAPVAR